MSRVYETAIKIGAAISKTFRADTYNAAAALTKLTDATKRMKEAEKAAQAYKRLDEAVAKSKAKYDQASAALRQLESAEKAAGGATKESTQWRKAGERAVAKAAREMDRATKAAEKNGKALREMGVDTSKLASEQERLAKTLANTERQQKALASFEASRERLFGKRKDPVPLFAKAGDQIRGVARDAALLGTAAFGASAAMAGLVLKTLKAGDEIGDTAEKLGIGSTALQELRYGAKQSGAETEELDRSLGKMLVTIGKFKAAKPKGGGGGGAPSIFGLQMLGVGGEHAAGAETDPFKRIGLNAKALSLLKPEEQLKKIADGMQRLKTHADRAAIAQAIFGKGAVSILPFLAEGSKGIDKLSAAGHKFGGIMSEEAVKAADQADKAMKDAEMAVAGLTATLGSALLPTAVRVFREFSQWVASNRGQIQKWAENAAMWIEKKAIPAIITIGGEIKSVAAKVVHLVEMGAKLTGGFDNLAIAVAGLRLAPLALTLSKIGVEGVKAAIAIFKYAAATQAAKAAEAAGGAGGGGTGGVVGGVVRTVAGAAGGVAVPLAVIGAGAYALHKTGDRSGLINKLNRSDEAVDPEAARIFGSSYAREHRAVIRRGGMQLVTAGSSGTGGGLTYAPQITIGATSKEDLGQKIDTANAQAKQQALEGYDRAMRERRRVSFAE